MRVLVASDLHFEFHVDGGEGLAHELAMKTVETNADALVVAGDLSSARGLDRSLDVLEKHVGVPIVYVAGNHEHYGASLALTRARRNKRTGETLRWLDCSVTEVGSQRFVGCTLWFRLAKDAWKYSLRMNDFGQIKDLARDVDAENRRCLEFLEREVREGDAVVTHYLPSNLSVPARFASSPLNQFYVCPVEDLIRRKRPAVWVHGHTHDSFDYRIGGTRIVCNPFGYVGHDRNSSFRFDLVVEL